MLYHISPKLLKYFKGYCSSPEIIMLFVYMKSRFSLSYRDIEEIAMIRSCKIDDATLQRWVVKFTSLIEIQVKKYKKPVIKSWRMDETYIKVNGFTYIGQLIHSLGQTVDFLLRKHRALAAAKAFFRKAFKNNGLPEKVVIDKSVSHIIQNKYLNNIIEEDHRFVKKGTRPMLGFRVYHRLCVS